MRNGVQRLNYETSTRRRGYNATIGRCTIRDSRGLISSAQMNNVIASVRNQNPHASSWAR